MRALVLSVVCFTCVAGVLVAQERGLASVCGTVLDASESVPIADAMVYLSGTPFAAATDDAGGFCMPDVPGGQYELALFHIALGGVEAPPPTVPITIGAGTTLIEWVISSIVVGSEGLRRANPGEPYSIEPIVVRAEGGGLGATELNREGASVAVIGRAEIEELLVSARDVGDVLEHVSGVRIRRVATSCAWRAAAAPRRRVPRTATAPPGG